MTDQQAPSNIPPHQHQFRRSDIRQVPNPEKLPDTYEEPAINPQEVVPDIPPPDTQNDPDYDPNREIESQDAQPVVDIDTGEVVEADVEMTEAEPATNDNEEEEEDNEDDDDDENPNPTRTELPELRSSTLNQPPGTYTEDESLLDVDHETLLEGPAGEQIDDREDQRRVTAYVAASHRKNLPTQSKLEAAERASALYEKITGYPLEINSETGEVVTEPKTKSPPTEE